MRCSLYSFVFFVQSISCSCKLNGKSTIPEVSDSNTSPFIALISKDPRRLSTVLEVESSFRSQDYAGTAYRHLCQAPLHRHVQHASASVHDGLSEAALAFCGLNSFDAFSERRSRWLPETRLFVGCTGGGSGG